MLLVFFFNSNYWYYLECEVSWSIRYLLTEKLSLILILRVPLFFGQGVCCSSNLQSQYSLQTEDETLEMGP